MRILHLTHELPQWPGGTGGATRQFHLLRRLVELGHDVTVVAPATAAQAAAAEATVAAGIELITALRPSSRPREVLAALRRRPSLVPAVARLPVLAWQVEVFWTALRPLAEAALRELRPDVVSVEHDNAARWIDDLDRVPPAVLTLHNVSWHYYENRARAASGPRRAALHLEARRFRRHDVRLFNRFARLVAVSERDRDDLLEAFPESVVGVVPNGVASDEVIPAPPSAEPATLLFTGTLDHPPNAAGIAWFAGGAWRRIRAARPDARLLVVGRNPTRQVSQLDGRDGIEVIGPVPDMAPWFERATAVVVPLRSGGGTRLKILEAFASGRAVVSTRTGAEGLAVESGHDLLLADSEKEIADGVLALLDDPPRRERLAAAGRALAERSYDWRVLGDALEAVLRDAQR